MGETKMSLSDRLRRYRHRILFYFMGMVFLAFGIMLNSKVNLGVAPITTIAFAGAEIYPYTFADLTLVEYSIFVVIEMIIHFVKKKRMTYYLLDLAQIPFSIVFTRIMAVFGVLIPNFAVAYEGTFMGSIPFRLVILGIAFCSTGIGAMTMLNMALIPNPADGVVQALASLFGWEIPKTKTRFDLTMIVVTIVFCLAHGRGIIGINIGSVLAVLCIGRVMGIYNKFTYEYMTRKVEEDLAG